MLHIHNGDSTAGTLKEHGFPGEHIPFKEILMDGPCPAGLSESAWRKVRADFIGGAFRIDPQEIVQGLEKQEATLSGIPQYDEVVLWFEHDLFCQVHLVYLLNRFAEFLGGQTRLSMICVGSFPGKEHFGGLGELTGEQLASLFGDRREVTSVETDLASQAWAAYCAPTPEPLKQFCATDTSALPFLGDALRLHLTRFPSAKNGLGSVENLAISLIQGGHDSFKKLFPVFFRSSIYGMGDASFWNCLTAIAKSDPALLVIEGVNAEEFAEADSNTFLKSSFRLTDTGLKIAAGELDYVETCGIDLWLGGVHLVPENVWRA
ncbi:MAG TPA: DUF1835 domain-containing protein [Blastocatellia bacterium]|nr:DUF1835 domain-containing protein [Blastocatellia bacterium]